MAYADYEYYTSSFLEGADPAVPESAFARWEKQAELEIDAITHGRTARMEEIPDKVKECACAITELLYEASVQAEAYRTQGLSGPLTSWSNDGQSGTVDLGQSVYTEAGKRKEIHRLCSLYLGPLGLLFAGVLHYES